MSKNKKINFSKYSQYLKELNIIGFHFTGNNFTELSEFITGESLNLAIRIDRYQNMELGIPPDYDSDSVDLCDYTFYALKAGNIIFKNPFSNELKMMEIISGDDVCAYSLVDLEKLLKKSESVSVVSIKENKKPSVKKLGKKLGK